MTIYNINYFVFRLVNFVANSVMHQADLSQINNIVNKAYANGYINIPSEDLLRVLDLIFREVVPLLHFNKVQGYLDDLIGQRLSVEMLLFLSSIFVIILVIVFIINLIFYLY